MNINSLGRREKAEFIAKIFLCLFALLFLSYLQIRNNPGEKNGGSEYVLKSRDGKSLAGTPYPKETTIIDGVKIDRTIVGYLKNKYKTTKIKEKDIKVSAGYPVALASNNIDQERIKKAYNESGVKTKFKTGPGTGICWSSAITSFLEYNSGKAYNGIQLGTVVIRTAVDRGYVSATGGGLGMGPISGLTTEMLRYVGISGKQGNTDYYDIWDTMQSEFNQNRVVMFGIPNHVMCACGVEYARTSWIDSKGKTVTKTDEFVVVNDTWADSSHRRYSFYPVEKIGTNIISRWDYGIIKLIKR